MNYFLLHKNIAKLLIFFIAFSFTFSIATKDTHAVFGAGDTVVVVGDASPTGIENFINHTMDNLKNFVLDKAATLIAKQILHSLTVSVINWINTGFEGSPSFLTNPGAFFLDAADQVTGAFLASNGPLSSLCSPFAIDIRLSLALSQTALSTQRYTCTLGKIIEAQSNGPDVIVNGQVVRSSMGGFLQGDFNQGGWPAFVALTTEPQNNPYGAFLSAQGDLSSRINARQGAIQADLQLGSGFMSWSDCKDIPGSTFDPNNEEESIEAARASGINNPGVKVKKHSNGTNSFQTCETKTPGSVISNSLETSLNVPVRELELADDINAVINALMNKMITTMMSSGLSGLSGSAGGENAYTQEVINEINSEQAMDNVATDLKSTINTSILKIPLYNNQYQQATQIITASKNRYTAVKTCLTVKPYAYIPNGGIVEIDGILSYDVEPLLEKLNAKYKEGLNDKQILENMITRIDQDPITQVQIQSNEYTTYLKKNGAYLVSKIDEADTALANAQAQAQKYNTDLLKYQVACPGI